MTESEWLACTQANAMLCFLDEQSRTSPRKFRLYACAVCRRHWPLLHDARSRQAVEVAERYAEGQATTDELWAAFVPAKEVADGDLASVAEAQRAAARQAARAAAATAFWAQPSLKGKILDFLSSFAIPPYTLSHFEPASALAAAIDAVYYVAQAVAAADPGAVPTEQKEQAALLREMIGNPFRPGRYQPSWLRRTPHRKMLSLAHRIYSERRFRDLPRLADSLRDAGCDDQAILTHCRAEGEHVRGCWVIDLILGKA